VRGLPPEAASRAVEEYLAYELLISHSLRMYPSPRSARRR
jgi:hypothetical protein